MSGEGSECLSWLPTGTSPPSFWCSTSGSWTHTPEGPTLAGELQSLYLTDFKQVAYAALTLQQGNSLIFLISVLYV